MITDWNSPQGDFDPTEKQGELLMLLSGQQVTVHTSAEDDFDYMENEDVAFVVKNPHSEEDLLIELCGEFSVFFEKWHGEYPATEEGLCADDPGRAGCSGRQRRGTEPVHRGRLAGHGPLHGKARPGCRRSRSAGALLERRKGPTSLWRRAAGWSWCTGTRHRTGP